jgi:hypothetical protein
MLVINMYDMDVCANIINVIPVTSDMYDHLFS